jgi:hypothetical protein
LTRDATARLLLIAALCSIDAVVRDGGDSRSLVLLAVDADYVDK